METADTSLFQFKDGQIFTVAVNFSFKTCLSHIHYDTITVIIYRISADDVIGQKSESRFMMLELVLRVVFSAVSIMVQSLC